MSVETWELRNRANIEIIAIKINSKHKGNKTEGRVETRQAEIKLVPGEKDLINESWTEPNKKKKLKVEI